MFVVDCSYVSTISLYMYLNTPSSMTSLLAIDHLSLESPIKIYEVSSGGILCLGIFRDTSEDHYLFL
jgi:hypothetical protein